MGEDKGRIWAVLAASGGAALLGFTPIAMRVSELGPQATNFWRFALALPILAVMAAAGGPKPDSRQTGWLLLAGLMFGLEISLWAAALDFTTVANATLLANMTPLFAAAFAWVLLKERLSESVLAGGVTALIGAIVLALARAQSGQGPSPEQGWLGDGLGLTAAIGYAGYLLIVRSLRGRVGVGPVMFWAGLASAAFALAAALVMREPLIPRTFETWALLIALALGAQVLAQGLIAWGVGRLPIALSTVLLWLQPLSAAALSWLLFDERLGWLALCGAALILGGVFVVQRARA
ncbi:MAG: DMT family transporter [Hyphomonadaceae bacterium]